MLQFYLCVLLLASEAKSSEDLPPISQDFQTHEISPVYAVQARTLIINGADETTLEIENNLPCEEMKTNLLRRLEGAPVKSKGQTGYQRIETIADRIESTCKAMIQNSIDKPLRDICETVNAIGEQNNVKQRGRILPLIVWAGIILTTTVISGGSTYLGYQLAENSLVNKINQVNEIMNANVRDIANTYEDLQEQLERTDVALNITIENIFHLTNLNYMLEETRKTVLDEQRLPRAFLEFYNVTAEHRRIRHQVLVSCAESPKDSQENTKWIFTYRTPQVNPQNLYRSESFDIKRNNCIVQFHGPSHLIHDPQTNASCWVNLDHAQANQPVIILPDCIEREYSYKELERRDCKPAKGQESVDKIILQNATSIIYCQKNIIVDDKWYRCPDSPFEIVSYNQPNRGEGRPTGRRVQRCSKQALTQAPSKDCRLPQSGGKI